MKLLTFELPWLCPICFCQKVMDGYAYVKGFFIWTSKISCSMTWLGWIAFVWCLNVLRLFLILSKLSFTYSNSEMETPGKYVKMFKVNNKDNKLTVITPFSCHCSRFWAYFTNYSSVSIFDFEQVNANWESTSVIKPRTFKFFSFIIFLFSRSNSYERKQMPDMPRK